MASKFALLINLLIASAVLGAPSRLEACLTCRHENHQSRPLNRIRLPAGASSNVQYSPTWAGAVWDQKNGTFTQVTGTFTVPRVSGPGGSAASAWVGIDGETCRTAILQTGVNFEVHANKSVSYSAWFEWWPDLAFAFPGITISAGDVINATVVAHSTTSGVAIIENLTTKTRVTHTFSSQPTALCLRDAEWIVEDHKWGVAPFANFGTVTFSAATASGPGGSFTPSGAIILDIQQSGKVLTSTSVHGNDLTITYNTYKRVLVGGHWWSNLTGCICAVFALYRAFARWT